MTYDLRLIVNVRELQATVPSQRRRLGEGLFLTDDASVLSAGGAGRLRRYTSKEGLDEDFASSTEVSKAAARWFGQEENPHPLWVGRWTPADIPTRMVGSTTHTAAGNAPLNASDASFRIGGQDVSGVDLSSATTATAIATALQTAVQALSGGSTNDARFSGALVSYGPSGYAGRYVIRLADGQFGDIGEFLEPHSQGTGTDISGALGFAEASVGRIYQQGAAGVDADQALTELYELNDTPSNIVLDETLPTAGPTKNTRDAVAAWVQSRRFLTFTDRDNAPQTLVTNDASSEGSILFDRGYGSLATVYDKEPGDYKAASAAGLAGTVDFTQPNGYKTLFAKTLPGCRTDSFNATELAELERKRINFYVDVAGLPTFLHGTMSKAGEWWDIRLFKNWFAFTLELDIFDLFRSTNFVPYTDAGVTMLIDTISAVCNQGVDSGAIAPGQLTPAATSVLRRVTGDANHTGFLENGFEIWFAPVASVTASRRASREAPAGYVWQTGSQAIQKVSITTQLV